MAATPALYGPINLEIPVTTTGNPYDPRENDVHAIFHQGDKKDDLIAYYAHEKWHVRGYVSNPGDYTIEIVNNGQKQLEVPGVHIGSQPQKNIIHAEGKWFFDGANRPFWPIGINTAWGSQDKPVTSYFPKMKEAGMNWSRVWACHWDDHNPWWTNQLPKPKDNFFSEEVFDRWDDIVKTAEKNDIHFQFVCFHHGQWSSSVNPNWPDNPWNAKNGGFLKSASDFFTDPEAKRRTKMMLRYLVARYGYSSSIMAWELFNEVQFVDRIREKNDWATVGQWHDEMADYVRSIDSAHHLITTSSELGQPLWGHVDYQQGHGYPSSVAGMLAGTPNNGPKPMFFGEIGPSGAGNGLEANIMARREGIWAAFFAGHSGAGQYWSWDQMNDAAFKAYGYSIELIKHLPPAMTFNPQAITTKVAMGGDLSIRPGRGWDKSEVMTFNLPQDAVAAKTGMMSSFFQGTGHQDMQPQPFKFVFTAPAAGSMKVHVAEVSGGGGKLEISVNGVKVVEKPYMGGQRVTGSDANLSVPYAAGDNEIVVSNTGADWVNVDKLTFTGIAPEASVQAIRRGRVVVAHALASKSGVAVELGNLGVDQFGNVQMMDLDSMTMTPVVKSFRGGKALVTLPGKDVILVFRP